MNSLAKSAWRSVQIDQHGWAAATEEFALNELQRLEIATHASQPWVVDGEDWLVINIILPKLNARVIERHRLCVLLGEHEAVILHDEPLDEAVAERLKVHARIGTTPTGALAIIADVVSERFTPILDAVDEAIDRLEDLMIDRASDHHVRQLFHNKKILSDLRRIVLPTMMLLNSLSDGRFRLVADQQVAYLRDSYDYAWRAHELIDTQRDLLSSVLDTYLSVMSNRMNDIMKRLTLVATIFMPITFLTGIGGMNFLRMPFDNDVVLYGLLASMLVIPVLMLGFFYYKKWY